MTEIFFPSLKLGFSNGKPPDLSRCLCFIFFKILIRNFKRCSFQYFSMLTLRVSVLGSCPYSETDCLKGQEKFWHVLFFILLMKKNFGRFVFHYVQMKVWIIQLQTYPEQFFELSMLARPGDECLLTWGHLLVLQGLRGDLGGHGPVGALRNLWCNGLTLGQILTKNTLKGAWVFVTWVHVEASFTPCWIYLKEKK